MNCPIIYTFSGEYRFLSNFFPVAIRALMADSRGDSVEESYPSVEHAFQAAKSLDAGERREFQNASLRAGDAKHMGRFVTLRRDWEGSKVSVMAALLAVKFQEPALRAQLIATAPKMLVEGNYWHDNFWGVCFCPREVRGCQGRGVNNLGKLLMNLREEIQ